MGTAWTAIATLVLGMLLTLTYASAANVLMHRALETAADWQPRSTACSPALARSATVA